MALDKAGRSMAASIAMIAITTNNSIKVNAGCCLVRGISQKVSLEWHAGSLIMGEPKTSGGLGGCPCFNLVDG